MEEPPVWRATEVKHNTQKKGSIWCTGILISEAGCCQPITSYWVDAVNCSDTRTYTLGLCKIRNKHQLFWIGSLFAVRCVEYFHMFPGFLMVSTLMFFFCGIASTIGQIYNHPPVLTTPDTGCFFFFKLTQSILKIIATENTAFHLSVLYTLYTLSGKWELLTK